MSLDEREQKRRPFGYGRSQEEARVAAACMQLGAVVLRPPRPQTGFGSETAQAAERASSHGASRDFLSETGGTP